MLFPAGYAGVIIKKNCAAATACIPLSLKIKISSFSHLSQTRKNLRNLMPVSKPVVVGMGKNQFPINLITWEMPAPETVS